MVELIIFGTIALGALIAGGTLYGVENGNSVDRMARFQSKVETGKIRNANRAKKIFMHNVKRQFHALKFGTKDILMRTNSLPTQLKDVAQHPDFEPILVDSELRRKVKRLYRFKAKKIYKEYKHKRVGRLERKITKLLDSGVKDVVKEKGFIKSQVEDGRIGGSYLREIASDGTRTYHSVKYGIASTPARCEVDIGGSVRDYTFAPDSLYEQLLNKGRRARNGYIIKYGSRGAKFSRFGIDYPNNTRDATDRIPNDRMILGCKNTRNPMYRAAKLLILTKACWNFNNDSTLDKIRMIETEDGVSTGDLLTRDEFKNTMKKYFGTTKPGKEFKKALKEINEIDPTAGAAIESTISRFVGVSRTSRRGPSSSTGMTATP